MGDFSISRFNYFRNFRKVFNNPAYSLQFGSLSCEFERCEVPCRSILPHSLSFGTQSTAPTVMQMSSLAIWEAFLTIHVVKVLRKSKTFVGNAEKQHLQ